METPAFKIECRCNTDAIVIAENLEKYGIIPDERNGRDIFISIEAYNKENPPISDNEEIKEEIMKAIEDACMVYELDYTPDITEEDHDFDDNDINSSGSTLRYRDDGGTDG